MNIFHVIILVPKEPDEEFEHFLLNPLFKGDFFTQK